MAGRSNDDHAKALEALSGGTAENEASEAAPAPAPTPAPAAAPKRARVASPLDAPEARPAEVQSVTADPQPAAMPAPTSAPAPLPKAAAPAAVKAVEQTKPRQPTAPTSAKQIELKRTLIPLMLTMGTVLPLGGLVSILMGEDSLIGEELTLPISMMVLGLLILAAAILTMLQVKTMLARNAR